MSEPPRPTTRDAVESAAEAQGLTLLPFWQAPVRLAPPKVSGPFYAAGAKGAMVANTSSAGRAVRPSRSGDDRGLHPREGLRA